MPHHTAEQRVSEERQGPTEPATFAYLERPVHLIYCYAPEDGRLLEELAQHLALSERQRRIKTWHEGQIGPGLAREPAFEQQLYKAEIVLLLISASFLASDRLYSQLEQILRLRRAAGTRVIPILLHRVSWESAPFAELQVLPRSKVPVTAWADRQAAWTEVSKAILGIIDELEQARRVQPPSLRVQSFDAQVAELYRLLHYEVEAGKVLAEQCFDLYLTMHPGDITIRRAVACHPGPLNPRAVEDFIRKLAAARLVEKGLLGTIVTGASFAAELVEQAQADEVQLITLRELSARLLEGRVYAERLVREIESDPKYPVSLYIQPSIALDSGGGRSAPEVLHDWLSDPSWNQMTLLGDVGTGKTFLSRMLAHRLATAYLKSSVDNPLPILVDLRNADRQLSLEGLVLTHLHNHGLPRATFDVFQHALSAGQVAVIFDGFDEMAARVTPQVTMRNFSELTRCVRGRAKVLITCRTHYFKSRSDEELVILDVPAGAESGSELYWDLAIRKGFQIAYLRPFETWQIEEYVMKVKGDGAKLALQRIRDIYNLMELSRRPMLLDMIVKSIDRLREDTNAANLYEVFTNIWIHRDRHRDVLAPDEKRRILRQLAWHLWSRKSTTIHYKDLLDHLEQHDPRRANDPAFLVDLDNEVRTASFLVRDGEGNYCFAHKSYAEFFLARHILDCLERGEEACLDAGLLPSEVIAFFWQLASAEYCKAIANRLSAILVGPYIKNLSENALLIIHNMITGKRKDIALQVMPAPLCLPGAKLDGVNLEGLQASGAELGGASLIGAHLANANFAEANLKGINLQSADLRTAYLSNANLSDASLQLANLEGASLQGAVLDRADLTDAILLDADFNRTSMTDMILAGLWLPRMGSPEPDPAKPRTISLAEYEVDMRELWSMAMAGMDSFEVPEHEREDLAADVVMQVYISLTTRTFKFALDRERLQALVGIGAVTAFRSWRSRSRRTLHISDSELAPLLVEDSNPDSLLLAKEKHERLLHALDTLEPRARTLMQQVIRGMTMKEIATQLGVSESNAQQIFIRAKQKLRKAIEWTEE